MLMTQLILIECSLSSLCHLHPCHSLHFLPLKVYFFVDFRPPMYSSSSFREQVALFELGKTLIPVTPKDSIKDRLG